VAITLLADLGGGTLARRLITLGVLLPRLCRVAANIR